MSRSHRIWQSLAAANTLLLEKGKGDDYEEIVLTNTTRFALSARTRSEQYYALPPTFGTEWNDLLGGFRYCFFI